MLNASQKRTKRARFHARVNVQDTRKICRLICDDTDGPTIHPRKAHHDVPREMLVHFKEVAIVHDAVMTCFMSYG